MWYVHPKPEKEQPDTVSLALVESKNAAVEIQKTKEKLSKKAGNNTISSLRKRSGFLTKGLRVDQEN